MRKKVGCPKKVIKEQIEKYERVLKNKDSLLRWLNEDFGAIALCPVCLYRSDETPSWCSETEDHYECPSTVNGIRCTGQEWYSRLLRLIALKRNPSNMRQIRSIVKSRLQYWKDVYGK